MCSTRSRTTCSSRWIRGRRHFGMPIVLHRRVIIILDLALDDNRAGVRRILSWVFLILLVIIQPLAVCFEWITKKLRQSCKCGCQQIVDHVPVQHNDTGGDQMGDFILHKNVERESIRTQPSLILEFFPPALKKLTLFDLERVLGFWPLLSLLSLLCLPIFLVLLLLLEPLGCCSPSWVVDIEYGVGQEIEHLFCEFGCKLSIDSIDETQVAFQERPGKGLVMNDRFRQAIEQIHGRRYEFLTPIIAELSLVHQVESGRDGTFRQIAFRRRCNMLRPVEPHVLALKLGLVIRKLHAPEPINSFKGRDWRMNKDAIGELRKHLEFDRRPGT
eukprot:comp22518_c0_seq3/m.56541 comp22518_c0_seq3/g.56541  ORF comp22518_c0_seq3/g.56541 comp22518_c0_seq3/m.56541 type:complete len:330 (+) comp22518_c0_seq3:1-990(+)